MGDGLLRRRRRGCSARCSTGRPDLFPRAAELPAGPPSDDAVLVTCAYLIDPSKPWVMQSLFLTAIGEARDQGARALEAFAYRYARGRLARSSASTCTRRSSRATSSPTSASSDVRMQGRVELARLELGGLVAGRRRARARRVLRVVREAFVPAPAPQRPRRASDRVAEQPEFAAAWRAPGPRETALSARICQRSADVQPLCGDARRADSSAIWIAFSAAPLIRLSQARKSARPLLRRAVGADPADEHLVGLRRVARRRDVDDAAPTARRARIAVACSGAERLARARSRPPPHGRRAPARARSSR